MRLELLERQVAHSLALVRDLALDIVETLLELVVRQPERRLGLDAELAGEVGDGEEQVADLFLGFGRVRAKSGDGLPYFANLFVDLVEHILGLYPVETDGRHPGADLV